ncbi:MAG TPA: zinc finger Ran-binding domain-containing protein [Pyrinomonadaceae bacterium]
MNSIKCPNCGLINFATATSCKRCKHDLEDHSYPYWREKGAIAPATPDWSTLQTVPAVPVETEHLADYGDGSHTIWNRLFGIGLAANIFFMPYSVSYMNSALPREIWKLIVDPKSKLYLASFELLYYLVLAGAAVFTFAAVLLLITLCLKLKVFLTWVRIYLLVKILYFALEAWIVFRVETELREKHIPQLDLTANQIHSTPYVILIFILLTILWFRYFTTSKRARAVFE